MLKRLGVKNLIPFSFTLILVFLSFLSLALGQFSALSKSEGTNVYLFDILIGFTAIFNLVYLLAVKKTFYIPKAAAFLLAFIGVGVISLFAQSAEFSYDQLISATFYAFRFVIYLLFSIGILNLIKTKNVSLAQIYTLLIFFGAIVAICGYIQLFLLPDFTLLDPVLGWDPHKNRLASTFFDPNFIGAYLSIILVLYISALTRGLFAFKRIFSSIIICVLGIAIILTFSRSAWLMLAVMTFYYSYMKNRKLIYVGLLLIFLAYYSVPRIQTRITGTTDPNDSAHFRLISWSNTYKIIEDYPLIGVGYNGLRFVQLKYGFVDYDSYLGHSVSGSDSSVLFIAATTGILGLVFFSLGLLLPFITRKPSLDDLFVYKLIILGLILESQFINSLFYPQILVIWLLLLLFSYL